MQNLEFSPVTTEIRNRSLALFGLLLAVYLLTFSGTFTSIDELALFAKTEAIVRWGGAPLSQLQFAQLHNPVGVIEPGYALVATPLYLLSTLFESTNSIHLVMLLNPLLTAASAALLYGLGRQLGFGKGALVAALGFGLTSLAWPYARTLYREPLVAFGWILAFKLLISWRFTHRRAHGAIGIIVLLSTLLVKAAAAFGIPFLLLALLLNRQKGKSLIRSSLSILAVMVLVAAAFEGLHLLRYGQYWTPLDGSLPAMQDVFTRVYGQLSSPGKGLLFYMPSVLLLLAGAIPLWKMNRLIAVIAIAPLLVMTAAYSYYEIWYGGRSWGTRFLVPALPLAFLALAALWDSIASRLGRLAIITVLALSLLIQAAVSTAPWEIGYEPFAAAAADAENSVGLDPGQWRLSPPLQQLSNWRADQTDMIWLHSNLDGTRHLAPELLAAFVLTLLASLLLLWKPSRTAGYLGILPAFIGLLFLVGFGPGHASAYPGMDLSEAERIAAWVEPNPGEPYTLVTVSNEYHINFLLGYLDGQYIHHWHSSSQVRDFDSILENTTGRWLLLNVDRVHVEPEKSGRDLEYWLNERLFRADSTWIGGYELIRYALPDSESYLHRLENLSAGDLLTLDSHSVSSERLLVSETLLVELELCRAGRLLEDQQLFLHLVAPGLEIRGFDGPVRFGGLSLDPWDYRGCLMERRAIPVPLDAVAGQYDLVFGLTGSTGEAIPVTAPGRPAGAPYAILRQIEVVSRDR